MNASDTRKNLPGGDKGKVFCQEVTKKGKRFS